MYDSQWSESLRSGNLVQVPEWMSEGAARFAARGLDAESEAHPRRLSNGAFGRLDQSAGREAAVLGQAIWAYVSDIYGSAHHGQRALHDTHHPERRKGSGRPRAFTCPTQPRYHLRHAPKDHDAWMPDFTPKALRQARRSAGRDVPMPLRRRFEYTRLIPSPDGTNSPSPPTNAAAPRAPWTWNQARRGGRSWDTVWPGSTTICTQLAWHPQGKTLAFATELRGAPQLGLVNMRTTREM